MKTNVGTTDRLTRIVGLALLNLALILEGDVP